MNRGYQREGNRQGCQQTCGCQRQGSERGALLQEIQRTDFILNDLQLYLDNHPSCEAALEDFNAMSQLSMELKEQYHQLYGPIINYGIQTSEFPWQWTEDPWPWERNFMSGQ